MSFTKDEYDTVMNSVTVRGNLKCDYEIVL